MTWACDIVSFKKFLGTAKPNDKFNYYLGYSLMDSVVAKELQKIAYEQALKGEVYLVQKKVDLNYTEYIMVKASRPPVLRLVPLASDRKPPTINRGTFRYVQSEYATS